MEKQDDYIIVANSCYYKESRFKALEHWFYFSDPNTMPISYIRSIVITVSGYVTLSHTHGHGICEVY